ncbi:MAG: ABC transporter permease [Anaerolineae bacterium]|nr:ABC transporter permease [Anaerolineae bacterium]
MTFSMILKRMRREWRSLAILLLAVCLLTGFFALGPFYIRAVTDVGLRVELDSAPPEDRLISLIIDGEPITPESLAVVSEQLGDLAVDYVDYIRADYTPPATQGSLDTPGLATSGYVFRYGDPVTPVSPRTNRAYQPFAFSHMPEILTLVEGRWPVRLPPPADVNPVGLSDAEQHARQIGIYNRGQVEVIVTSAVAAEAELELGSRIVLGTLYPDGSGRTASIVVVGIVDPIDPTAPFWQGNRSFLEGVEVDTGLGVFRYDFGMATIPESYNDWLRDVVPGSSYIYKISTNTDTISADNIQEINDSLQILQSRLSAYHPGISVLSGLTSLLEGYSADVSDTEGPIILLSGAILVMLLYHLINTVALVLEQQGPEWSALVSRGANVRQLVGMQLVTVGMLGLLGLIAGPLLSILFMRLLERYGPLSTALGGRSLGAIGIPNISIYLSIGAAVAAVLVLTLPAFPAARRSLLSLKQLVSRPPTRPAWARYALDLILILIGIAFLLRLYYMVGGNFGDLLNNVIAAPGDVVELIADNLTETGGLNDPFNLLGPALMLTGLALLWLRLFPLLMDGLSRLFRNSRHLTTPLAVWNVSRDPGHYAQLVLLLVGTLALGTASLGLRETRDRGAWNTARDETGGSVRVETVPYRLDVNDVEWDEMDGVSTAAAFMRVVGDPGSTAQYNVNIFGIDPDSTASAFSVLKPVADPLRDVEIPPAPGMELPDNAYMLTVQVYSLPQARDEDPAISVHLTAYVQDALGVPYRVVLEPPNLAVMADDISGGADEGETDPPTPVEEWLTFEGLMPERGQRPYQLIRIGINSRQSNIDAFEHTIYIDRIGSQDIFGTTTPLESFEDTGSTDAGIESNDWHEAQFANPYAASWVSSTSNVSRVRGVLLTPATNTIEPIDGPTALRLDYRMGRVGGQNREPSLVVNSPDIGRLPVIVNRAFAEQFAGTGAYRSITDEPLAVGDEKNIVLNIGTGSVELGYRVVGVVDEFPTMGDKLPMMATHIDLLQPVVNQAAASNNYFTFNEVWMELPDREPSDALKAEIAGLDGVNNAAFAWDRFKEIQREPLPSAIEGMLYAGYWVSLLLSLLDFAFYLVVTARQRLFTFGVLRSLGWNAGHIWRLLLIEQITLITPALIIGSLIGAGLAYLLLPFLALVGHESLHLPWLSVGGLLLILVVSFTVLMGIAAVFLRRMSVNQVLRLGEE